MTLLEVPAHSLLPISRVCWPFAFFSAPLFRRHRASWKEVLDMKDKTVVRVQQEWSSKVAARTEGKEAAAATTVAANSATPAATK